MAEIVMSLATSHGPQLNIPPEQWTLLTDKDETDPSIDYAALLRQARPGLADENTLERWQERYAACHRALAVLREQFLRAAPDAMVVVGDDQHEQFLEDNMPMFSIYYGDAVTVSRRERPGLSEWQKAEEVGLPETPREFPAAPALARHLIRSLIDDSFDVACSNRLKPSVGLGHAFTFPYRYLLPEGNVPIVPVAVNCFFPPNQPTSRRCYALGESLRRAIESWDAAQRVVVIASGGLSHTIIEEDLDEAILDALQHKDRERLSTLPEERLIRGTSELRNWITLGAVAEPMDMTLVDFVPCYRSPAGTGCAMAFAYWQ